LAAVVVAIVLVGGVALAFFAATGQKTPPFGAESLPQDSLGFWELRLDLPDDQRANAVSFLSRFPGWADAAGFDARIQTTLDDFVSEVSDGRVVPSRDIAPWFDGRAFVAVSDIPTDAMDAEAVFRSYLFGVGVKDRAALQAAIDRFRAEIPGAQIGEEAHGGSTILTATLEGMPAAVSWVVTDTVLLVALDPAPIRESLDVISGAAPRLFDAPAFRQAFDRVPAGRLGSSYTNIALMRPIIATQMEALREQMGDLGMLGLEGVMDAYLEGLVTTYEMLPDHMVQVFTVDADHATMDVFGAPGPRTPLLSVRDTDLAGRMPAGAMVYLEARDFGVTVHNATEWVIGLAGDALPPGALDEVESVIGVPVEEYLDFVQDVGLAATFDGRKFQVGVAATLTDQTLAVQRVESFLTAVRGAAAQEGASMTVTETDVDGVRVSTIAATGDGPDDAPIDPAMSIALGDRVLLVGTGAFAEEALQRDAAGSLGGDARFQSALAAGGDPNAAMFYVDLAGIRTAAEAAMPGNQEYAEDVKPYLDPFDRFIVVVGSSPDLLSIRTQLFVK
jgi:hypothetical protein